MTRTTSRLLRTLAGVATAATLVGMALPSSAAVYRARWDPLFNPAFSSSIGWSGQADIDVSDGCVVPSMTVNFPNGCGTATLLSYSYTFYDIATPSSPFASDSGLGLGNPTAVSFGDDSVANGMDLPGNAIAFSLAAGTFSAYGRSAAYNAQIAFTIVGGPVLTLTEDGNPSNQYVSGLESCGAACTPDMKWSVPEPGSLALMGIALTSLAVFRRRRSSPRA